MIEARRRTAEGSVEATFHIPQDVIRALKMNAVQENKRFSKVAEDALRQYLRLPKEEESSLRWSGLWQHLFNSTREREIDRMSV